MTARAPRAGRTRLRWASAAVCAAGIAVVAWACLSDWDAVSHANPAYPALLAATAAGCGIGLWEALRRTARPPRKTGLRSALRILLAAGGAALIAAVAWLRPYPPHPAAVTALRDGGGVRVIQSPFRVVLAPDARPAPVGVFVQPGALVDARAYAAVLRPLAEHGFTVVIAKQPLGIAFLALGAFDSARSAYPDISAWILGGHSLGGTVAAIQAQAGQRDHTGRAAGLVLYASYPATDLSGSLEIPVESLSGSRDGLATPAKITASKADLPAGTRFIQIRGASHAQFGDYGPQPGDHTPTIGDAAARTQISAATVRFAQSVEAGLP